MKILSIVLATILLIACDDTNDGTACTEEARSSVTLKIIDADTQEPLTEADISYTVNGSDMVTITSCSDDEALVDNCESFPLTYEVAGDFEITVSADGYEIQTKTITIEEDECHVIGKNLTFKMSAS